MSAIRTVFQGDAAKASPADGLLSRRKHLGK